MKKLLLLALVVLGGVLSVNADRRIYVNVIEHWNDAYNDQGGIRLHMWVGNDGRDYYVTRIGNSNWFYADIALDPTTIGVQVYCVNTPDWKIENSDFYSIDLRNKYIELTNSSTMAVKSLDYSIFNPVAQSVLANMSTTDGLQFTCDVDNQTEYSASTEALITPKFMLEQNFGFEATSPIWSHCFRPYGNESSLGFENLTNRHFGLYNSSDSWKLTANAHYVFTFSPSALDDAMTISSYFTRTITDTYSTFSSDYNVAIPSGLNAYYVGTASSTQVNMTKFANGIRSTDGAFLQVVTPSEDNKYTFTPASTTDSPTTNLLLPTTGNDIPADSYVFASGANGLGFYKLASALSGVGKGKAYLQAGTYASRLSIAFDGEATGINSIENTNNAEGYYDLQGRRVAQPAKGLYIHNGKKIIK